MRFDLIRPCADCPFRNDVRPYLTIKRAEGILWDILKGDKTFACHNTTTAGTGRRILKRDQQHCAGALILSVKMGWPNWRVRFAAMLGIFNPSALKMRSPIYKSDRAMIVATKKEWTKQSADLLP